MSDSLETTDHPEKLRRVAIDPLTRVEGHGKVTLLLDEDNQVKQARLHIVEFRGFEKFIQNRPYWELPVLVQRLCGICPVSHHLAAAKACDQLIGASITPTAEKIRRLMHYGQVLQSHALHFFHLSSPDLLFGFDDEVRHRNIVGVIADYPDIAKQGVMLRKFGQEVIRVTAGKRIHGTGAIPGGVNKAVSLEERRYLSTDIKQVIAWAQEAVGLIKKVYFAQEDYHRRFAGIDSHMLSLVNPQGGFELYDGNLRAKSKDDEMIFDQQSCDHYASLIQEGVKNWTYMKFPFISRLGEEQGWYRVGPLARVNNCDFMDTPLAEEQRRIFREAARGGLVQSTLAFHWARLIELLYCAEAIEGLLQDDALSGDELVNHGALQQTGIGVIEAPRGTLFHHYEINQDGLVERANLIVSTTNNNQAMNESVRQVAREYLSGHEITEPLLNQIEVAIRAYDPCLSCATHALGRMPLEISLQDVDGVELDCLQKDHDGRFHRITP
ncbi:MAG: Ni/Fe hydrogenase subunit alpha [Gammaproteobacteria bacterium]|nr:Ni/Fe hydrogenase subunit alpha [Gammaproteobacteria bacterium]